MACYHPVTGYRSKTVNPVTRKRSIVYTPREGFLDLRVTRACGQCIGCRLDYSLMWACRGAHESTLYPYNSFITLTYSEKYLPEDLSLQKHHMQIFMKKLRDHRLREYGPWPEDEQNRTIRYMYCGEYGEEGGRPHYHAILFNVKFTDAYPWQKTHGGMLYRSPKLEQLWPLGHSSIGECNFQTIAYVARYITKKITGQMAKLYYTEIDEETGEVIRDLTPEFMEPSRRPGIGKDWYEKYKSDVFPDDFALVNQDGNIVKVKTPRYYRNLLEKEDPRTASYLKSIRKDAAENNVDNTWERLKTREESQYLKAKRLKRSFENGQA